MTKDRRTSEEPKSLRRSARLLAANAAKIQKPNRKQTHKANQSANPRNGVLTSTEKINGVVRFQGCRRSPRFSTPQISDKKSGDSRFAPQMCVKSRDGVEEFQSCRRSPRFAAITNTTPETVQTRNKCLKSRNGANLFTKKTNSCLDDPLKCAVFTPTVDKEPPVKGSRRSKSRKQGSRSPQFMCLREIDTPKKGKESPQEMALAHFRTPFGSIENITPENAKQNGSNKLLLLKQNVKSARMAIKQPVRSTNKQCGVQGWNKDQEMALHRAYFGAKPSPHFWKKISKLVPGKSAQECFDKIQLGSITTPQPQPRCYSRANRTNPSPLSHFSLSGSKLLESTKLNVKKSRGNKRTKSQAQKAVRHLLQKQNLASQGFKRDLFSILESTTSSFAQVSPEVKVLATPQCKLDTKGFLQDGHQRSSSSSQKKSFSRFRDSCLASIVSPPVLKPVKNMAIHEKYIDQLHNREVKRAAAGRRRVSPSENIEENVKKLDVIKEAKDNLVSEARDMIKKFQSMQANAMDISEDVIDTDGSSGTDDGECSI